MLVWISRTYWSHTNSPLSKVLFLSIFFTFGCIVGPDEEDSPAIWANWKKVGLGMPNKDSDGLLLFNADDLELLYVIEAYFINSSNVTLALATRTFMYFRRSL